MTPLPWWVQLYDFCLPAIPALCVLGVGFLLSIVVTWGIELAAEARIWFE